MSIDYTRGDSPAYNGYREAWTSQREQELQSRIDELEAELSGYREAERDGRLVVLPEMLVAPYELNERYWVCGWDLEDCTLTIQDRKLATKAEAALAAKKEAAE